MYDWVNSLVYSFISFTKVIVKRCAIIRDIADSVQPLSMIIRLRKTIIDSQYYEELGQAHSSAS